MNRDELTSKEFYKLFFSFFIEKDFLFGVFWGILMYAIVVLIWWLT